MTSSLTNMFQMISETHKHKGDVIKPSFLSSSSGWYCTGGTLQTTPTDPSQGLCATPPPLPHMTSSLTNMFQLISETHINTMLMLLNHHSFLLVLAGTVPVGLYRQPQRPLTRTLCPPPPPPYDIIINQHVSIDF